MKEHQYIFFHSYKASADLSCRMSNLIRVGFWSTVLVFALRKQDNKIISMAMFKAGKMDICCGERGIQGYSVDSTVLYVM
jgi:hypothetical protein